MLAMIVTVSLVRGWRLPALKQAKRKGSQKRSTCVSDYKKKKKKKITEGNYGKCSFCV